MIVFASPLTTIGLAYLRTFVQNAQQVLETPKDKRFNRHDSAVLSCPEFHGFGQDGATRKDARTTCLVFRTSCPPDARRKANGGFFLDKESETMAIQATRTPAQSTPTTGTIPTDKLTAVLGAFNAANLASSYIERGNFTAARRKLVQALKSIEDLTAKEGGAA